METHGNVKKANDRCYATLVFVMKHLKGNNKTVNSNNFGKQDWEKGYEVLKD